MTSDCTGVLDRMCNNKRGVACLPYETR